jgi:hypothetical protein
MAARSKGLRNEAAAAVDAAALGWSGLWAAA